MREIIEREWVKVLYKRETYLFLSCEKFFPMERWCMELFFPNQGRISCKLASRPVGGEKLNLFSISDQIM